MEGTNNVYVLKKELPDLQPGAEFTRMLYNGIATLYSCGRYEYTEAFIKSKPQWFEKKVIMQFHSDDRQDEFVANLLKFKRNGTYVDIGSAASIGSNNTYFFESLGWWGICIEKDSAFSPSYMKRLCKFLNMDALEVDYEKIFQECAFPDVIDYLSIDIDQESVQVLSKLPFDHDYRFRVITIEHDGHAYGDKYKGPQREFLRSKGYFLLCEDVLNQSGRNIGKEHDWEDWWVHPYFFEKEELERLYSFRLNTEQILAKF